MTTALKSICFFTAFLGIVTAAVCIWVIAAPVEMNMKTPLGVISAKWDGGDPAKVGIATAVLMIIIGIAACFVDLEKRFIVFVAGFLVILIIAIAFMSLAIKDHQNLKQVKEAQAIVKDLAKQSGAFSNSYNRGSNYGGSSSKYNPATDNIFQNDSLDKILTRLKVLSAVGAIDAIVMLISIIIFYVKRPKGSSRNVLQMERTL